MARDRFGLGINWLQQLTGADHDQGRDPLVPEPDLPPMFRPNSGVHKTMKIQVDVGSLGVGEKFWANEKRYEVMRNGGGKYIQAHGVNFDENRYFDCDEEVEVERDSD